MTLALKVWQLKRILARRPSKWASVWRALRSSRNTMRRGRRLTRPWKPMRPTSKLMLLIRPEYFDPTSFWQPLSRQAKQNTLPWQPVPAIHCVQYILFHTDSYVFIVIHCHNACEIMTFVLIRETVLMAWGMACMYV